MRAEACLRFVHFVDTRRGTKITSVSLNSNDKRHRKVLEAFTPASGGEERYVRATSFSLPKEDGELS